ncbi:hypothetical protein MHYP_G00347530 [Metynnis hypsauchen]
MAHMNHRWPGSSSSSSASDVSYGSMDEPFNFRRMKKHLENERIRSSTHSSSSTGSDQSREEIFDFKQTTHKNMKVKKNVMEYKEMPLEALI